MRTNTTVAAGSLSSVMWNVEVGEASEDSSTHADDQALCVLLTTAKSMPWLGRYGEEAH